MWVLLILGGGIIVIVLGPISVTEFGELNKIISSGLQTLVAIVLVIIWIIILSKMTRWIFHKEIKS